MREGERALRRGEMWGDVRRCGEVWGGVTLTSEKASASSWRCSSLRPATKIDCSAARMMRSLARCDLRCTGSANGASPSAASRPPPPPPAAAAVATAVMSSTINETASRLPSLQAALLRAPGVAAAASTPAPRALRRCSPFQKLAVIPRKPGARLEVTTIEEGEEYLRSWEIGWRSGGDRVESGRWRGVPWEEGGEGG